MRTNTVAKDGRSGPWAGFFGMASVAILARFATTQVHESFHFLVGRLAKIRGRKFVKFVVRRDWHFGKQRS